MQRAKIVILASALALLGSGCGGGDGDSGSSEEGAAVRDIQAEAQQTAESMVLELSDFPNGWRASPAEDAQGSESELRQCIGVDNSGFTITGEAASDTFAMGENAEAESASTVFESEQDAADAAAELSSGLGSTAAEGCYSDLITSAVEGEDYEVGEIDVGELSFAPPDNVEDASAWQIAIPVETQGVSATIYLELVVLREGSAVAQVHTQDAPDPLDPALRDELIAAVAARMAEASS